MPEHRRNFSLTVQGSGHADSNRDQKADRRGRLRTCSIHDGTLGNWVTWREHPEPGQASSSVERASMSELEEQNRRGCGRPDISPMIHYAQ